MAGEIARITHGAAGMAAHDVANALSETIHRVGES
jgi:hypothetical protein